MYCYICHVRRKDGGYDTGVDIYQGEMPKVGEIVTLVVHGETMKGPGFYYQECRWRRVQELPPRLTAGFGRVRWTYCPDRSRDSR
jgi:hypothetical protein